MQFIRADGGTTSVPITRRTLVPSAGGRFATTIASSVARDFGPLKTWQIDVPAGKKDPRVTFDTADTSADNVIDYFLGVPNGLDAYYDRTANTTPHGVEARTEAGRATLVVADPPAGRWTIQAMLDLTTSGRHFAQTVRGQVSYNTSRIEAYNVPDSPSTKLSPGSHTTLRLAVTNTTRIGREFALSGSAKDVSGSRVYIPAGATVLVTGVLTPKAAAGTRVSGRLTVLCYGSAQTPLIEQDEIPLLDQSVAQLPYSYTVGRGSAA